MPESTVRPLKCRFCWRRYKYEPCLEHHVRQVHQDAINQIMYRKYLLNLRLSVLHQLRKASKEASEKKSSEKMEIETVESNSESEDQQPENNTDKSTSSSTSGIQESEIQIIKVEPHEEFETRRSVIMHTSDISNK